MTHIVGILLAAGRATRFGSDKLLAPLANAPADLAAGTPVGIAAARHLVAAVPDSIAVVRAQEDVLAKRLRASGLRIVVCADADDGMGASLACGVAAARDADGWVIALADMPWIAPVTIRAVVDALAAGADIAVPAFDGERGHPVGFARRHYDALAVLRGDAGARALLRSHPHRVALLDVDDPGILRDVDTPADLDPAA
ncbi:MAG TPA: nucleotidyltransferase family protein [Casimicrobiaceae bacterium]